MTQGRPAIIVIKPALAVNFGPFTAKWGRHRLAPLVLTCRTHFAQVLDPEVWLALASGFWVAERPCLFAAISHRPQTIMICYSSACCPSCRQTWSVKLNAAVRPFRRSSSSGLKLDPGVFLP